MSAMHSTWTIDDEIRALEQELQAAHRQWLEDHSESLKRLADLRLLRFHRDHPGTSLSDLSRALGKT